MIKITCQSPGRRFLKETEMIYMLLMVCHGNTQSIVSQAKVWSGARANKEGPYLFGCVGAVRWRYSTAASREDPALSTDSFFSS
jgi:hypothetical protein